MSRAKCQRWGWTDFAGLHSDPDSSQKRGKNQNHLQKGEKRERRDKERGVGEGRMQGRFAYKWRENRKSQ